jgi:hypothetical protein
MGKAIRHKSWEINNNALTDCWVACSEPWTGCGVLRRIGGTASQMTFAGWGREMCTADMG